MDTFDRDEKKEMKEAKYWEIFSVFITLEYMIIIM